MKSTTRSRRCKMVCHAALCGATSSLLAACGPSPVNTELSSGVWMMEQTTRTRDGVLVACRPMLMEVDVTDEGIYFGTRGYPCEDEWVLSRALTLQRLGSSLLLDGVEVGTLAARRMDLDLPLNGRTISWNLDRPDAPWQELIQTDSVATLYQAGLSARPDSKPVAMPVEFTAMEEQEFSGRMHAAMLAVDANEGLEYVIQNEPTHGHFWALNATTGTFIYAPYPNFAGREEFTFFAQSLHVTSDVAPIGITITGTQDAPSAQETTFFADEDSWVSFPAMAKDPDGDPLTIEIVTQPARGNVTLDGKVFTYTPEPNFFGMDSFTYRAHDGTQWSNIATLQILVNSINDPPTVKDLNVVVTAGSATPLNLEVYDVESGPIFVESNTPPTLGVLRGSLPHFVYEPNPLVTQGQDSFELTISDEQGELVTANVKVTITPGTHKCTLLSESAQFNEIYPAAQLGSHIYYRPVTPFVTKFLGVTDGTSTYSQWIDETGTFGFDNNIGNVHRTTFFRLPATTYFTTSTTLWDMRLYLVSDTKPGLDAFDIPKPSNDISGEPSIGEPYVTGDSAYFTVQWPTNTQNDVCQVWKTNATTQVSELLRDILAVQGPCYGTWALAGEQYMFVGSKLMRVPQDSSPLVFIKDLNATFPERWMVEAGGKLFFQTRTTIGNETQIDLWVTDGTDAGTKRIKTLETSILEFDIFSPVAFGNKLYFAHRKSLWSSDGTEAGTSIVATMNVSSVIGNGAIGTLTPAQGKLFFLASTDAAGREPWVSDGTAAGTKMLRDIRVGPLGSATASTNPTYFHTWNGQVFFTADDDGPQTGLWKTEGTSVGTEVVAVRPMQTILGVLGNKFVFFDGHYLYSMDML